jgi:hemerythrin-like domain-containing protein
MLAQCDTLQELVPHIAQNGVDGEARSAIRKVINYFTTSAVHHHQDEEQDLFPLLNRQSLKLAEIIYRLNQEHDSLTQLWELLLQDLNKPATLAENADFESHVEQFCSAYHEHIDYENKELLGMAQHILSKQQLEDMGRAMARRRSVRQ